MSKKLSRAMLGALYQFLTHDKMPPFFFHHANTRKALERRGLIENHEGLYSLTAAGREKVWELWGHIKFVEHPPFTPGKP